MSSIQTQELYSLLRMFSTNLQYNETLLIDDPTVQEALRAVHNANEDPSALPAAIKALKLLKKRILTLFAI